MKHEPGIIHFQDFEAIVLWIDKPVLPNTKILISFAFQFTISSSR